MAVDGVLELDRTMVGGNLQTPHVRLASLDAAGGLGRVDVAARAVVTGIAAFLGFGLGALGVELFFRAEARVHHATFLQALKRGGVRVEALRLEVGAGLPANLGAFVPVKAKPLHGVEDDLRVLFRGALGVGVLDAQDERAARSAGERPVVDGRAGAADVQLARGGRCEANAHRFVLSHVAYVLT